MMTEPLLVVFDGNHFCFKSYNSGFKELRRTEDDEPSGLLFASIRSFLVLQRQLKPTHMVFAFDRSRSSFRTEILPSYKANRSPYKTSRTVGPGGESVEFDLQTQFEAFEEFLEIIGVSHYAEKRVEADDIISTLTKTFDKKLSIVIVSGDHDLHQLITSTTSVLKQGSQGKSDRWITTGSIFRDYGLPPERLPEVWSLEGDMGDNIQGIPRVGPVTAKKIIHTHGDLQSAIVYEPKCKGYERLVSDNYRLIVLDGTVWKGEVNLEDLVYTIELSTERLTRLYSFLEKWEFQSLVDLLELGRFWEGSGYEEPSIV